MGVSTVADHEPPADIILEHIWEYDANHGTTPGSELAQEAVEHLYREGWRIVKLKPTTIRPGEILFSITEEADHAT
jgi:hypothetical protein